MPRKQCVRAEYAECILDDCPGRFIRQSLPPKGRAQVNSKFEHHLARGIGPKPGASNMPVALEQKARPVLEATLDHLLDLTSKPGMDLF